MKQYAYLRAKTNTNGLAMARYDPRLSQDGATAHTVFLEAYLALRLFGPILERLRIVGKSSILNKGSLPTKR